jgi:hypothetical protein
MNGGLPKRKPTECRERLNLRLFCETAPAKSVALTPPLPQLIFLSSPSATASMATKRSFEAAPDAERPLKQAFRPPPPIQVPRDTAGSSSEAHQSRAASPAGWCPGSPASPANATYAGCNSPQSCVGSYVSGEELDYVPTSPTYYPTTPTSTYVPQEPASTANADGASVSGPVRFGLLLQPPRYPPADSDKTAEDVALDKIAELDKHLDARTEELNALTLKIEAGMSPETAYAKLEDLAERTEDGYHELTDGLTGKFSNPCVNDDIASIEGLSKQDQQALACWEKDFREIYLRFRNLVSEIRDLQAADE